MTQNLEQTPILIGKLRNCDPSEGIPVVRTSNDLESNTLSGVTGLLAILSYKRPFDSKTEEQFAVDFIDHIEGVEIDGFRNRHIKIPNADGSPSRTLWSCHIDTCHHTEGYQRLVVKKDSKAGLFYAQVRNRDEGNCLGADDGTGVWIMLEMIANKKPGYYIFHRGEERGCQGSKWLAEKEPDRFVGKIDHAIALDRKDFTNIITHQGGERCCSDGFARYIARNLMNFQPDNTGMFTDTKSYVKLIPECSNLSIGYQNNHGPLERQYVTFARTLKNALLELDTANLPTIRDPKKPEPHNFSGGYHSRSNGPYGPSYLDNMRWSHFECRYIQKDKAVYSRSLQSFVTVDKNPDDGVVDLVTIVEDGRSIRTTEIINGRPMTTIERKTIEDDEYVRDPITDKPLHFRKWQAKVYAADMELTLGQLIVRYPSAVMRLLENNGMDEIDILEELHGEPFVEYVCLTDDERLEGTVHERDDDPAHDPNEPITNPDEPTTDEVEDDPDLNDIKQQIRDIIGPVTIKDKGAE